jgi:hypothetical protein
MKITLQREYRPAWSEVVVAVSGPLVAPAAAPALSIADELGKLAKLRDEGTLTAAEFDAQKKKLLGN